MRLLKQLGQLLIVVAVDVAGNLALAAATGDVVLRLVFGFATAVLALLGYRWMVRLTERRNAAEAEPRHAASGIARGALIGAAMFGVVIGAIALLGGYRIDGGLSFTAALDVLAVMAAAAVTEELIFRGILFRLVEERLGTWIALAATGVAFGGAHLLNPNATLWGALAIAIEAGGMLAAAYVATRSLWPAIGIHFGWNFVETGIFGTEVSGSGDSSGLFHGVMSGPDWLTGGAFGPEASVFSVVLGIAVTAAFMVLAYRRGNVQPLRRRQRAAVAATIAR